MKRSETSIKTKRLWLRQIDETDAESIVALRSDENVYKYFLNSKKLTVDEHRVWYNNVYAKFEDRIDWIAVDDETGEFIGVYGSKKEDGNSVEVSYITNPDHQNKGFALEAVNGIIDWCVDNWHISSVTVCIHKDNNPSLEFVYRLGFKKKELTDKTFIKMNKYIE